ncbi:hypothetical protein AVEN_78279-1 [Araneus ventricosus]|uniref:Uncharacterized protein n=1 Tax=Araneus ventricosus TaxID=182803 RepID=A0A4Y2QB69_ARAVE|nr:hypothetical protein AVEN_255686-1 [Araneus ventricosus]GBN61447.1 hypothetical protein AVEN_78279-1 [Araneus ventricosus]
MRCDLIRLTSEFQRILLKMFESEVYFIFMIPQDDDRNLKLHQSEKEPSKCPSIFHHKKMKVEESTSCQTASARSPRGLSSSAIINIAKAAAGESAQNDGPI